MAIPESLKDSIENNNGHHDYSESISDLLLDIEDLDLSEIFKSNSVSVDPDSTGEDPVAVEPAVNVALGPNLADPEVEPEMEVEPISTEVAQDSDFTDFGADAVDFDGETFKAASDFADFEVEATEPKVEPVLETHHPETEVGNSDLDSPSVEAAGDDLAIAQALEPIESVAHPFEPQQIETESVETEPVSIHPEADAKSAEVEANSVLETNNLQTEILDLEAKDFENQNLLNFESESMEMKAIQSLEPAELEALAARIESNDSHAEVAPVLPEMETKAIEPEAAQELEPNALEPIRPSLALEDIKTQVENIKTEAKTESSEAEAAQPLKPMQVAPESINNEVDSTQVALQSQVVPQSIEKLAPAVKKSQDAWYKRLNLRTKATLLAIAIGTLPVIATGTLAYLVTSPTVKQNAIEKQEARISEAGELASRFIFERYGDIQVLADLPMFKDSKLKTTDAEKQATLDKYVKTYAVYDSIALLDLNGNVIAHSTGPQLPNYRDRPYFQTVLKTQKPFISEPENSKVTGQLSIFFAAPVFDKETGKMVAIIRSQMPVKYLTDVVEGNKTTNMSAVKLQQVFMADGSGKYFIANKAPEVGLAVEKDFSIFPQLSAGKKLKTEVYKNTKENIEELVTYSPSIPLEGLQELDWSILVASQTTNSFAALNNLELALMAGTAIASILVGALAAFIANRATRPIINSAEAVRKIGRGELGTRVSVSGQDELADLGTNINAMAEQLQTSLNQQQKEAYEKQLLAEIAQIREPEALEVPINTFLADIRETLQVERVVVYRFYPDWSGHIAGESVLPGWPVALASKIEDACIPQSLLDAYSTGRVVPTSDVFNAGFHPDHLDLMERLQIRANLVIPLLQGQELFGLMVAHHCASTHDWQQSEIDYLQEAANKMGTSLGNLATFERREYEAEQERARSQAIQMELMNLLGDVQGASDGDLTVRADVSAGEIGIVADFFNSIIENLRDIVSQVKDASAQVNTSVGSNEVVMGQMADEAQAQSLQVSNTLKSVEQMALSIQEVAENARQASKVAGIASTTAESGGKTMDRTVDSILMLRETVAETSKKVKRLGESSQQISKAVSLINQIALQTNLLAINASIEAARAGKEGRGFAVVAEEVGALAAQSAEATKEIEQIVETIQSETGEVVDAMERGTTQVVEGTRQVEEAKESLQEIVKVSRQIDKLLQSISSATVSQTEASEVVKQLMQQVTQSSERASDTSRQVSGSLQETVAIAQQLQASVGAFKVEN